MRHVLNKNGAGAATVHWNIDWLLFAAALPIVGAGLLALDSFSGKNVFFEKQVLWALISVGVFFVCSLVDWRFLKRTGILLSLFVAVIVVLSGLLLVGVSVRGAQSWFQFGGISFQPADFVKLLVILILAKYFSRRHIEIAHVRHIFVSAFYALVPLVLVFFQPDFGSAVIIFCIWLGMVVASGVSKKHLAAVVLLGIVSFASLWLFVFEEYQKNRIMTFLNPYTDIQGSGYNAYQSMVAVGSGELIGRGVGYGTQSRLQFLPEYQTDFIFAAFAEEWGFVGISLLFLLFGVVFWRILYNALRGASNFETLYGIGLAVFFLAHFVVHVGMNIGLMPVTGLPLPFMSYGGSHLLAEFTGLGILMGMRRYGRAVHRDDAKNEMVGVGE